jgi:oxygen-independent coproporphyrinogen-3 oxidase
MEDFLNALHREIELHRSVGDGVTFETIFFGGGTPSLLSPVQLGSILGKLRDVYDIAEDAEITLETNPGTVTREKLQGFKSLGVNRLSIGIQSFHEDELKFLSRIHDARQAIQCVEFAREAGFENLSVDLIFSIPGQTLSLWESNLEQALSLAPQHISAYSLIVEEHTPLARLVASKQVSPNPVEEEAEMYEFTMEFLGSRGFDHYEVSNYARPGFRSRHNYNYWTHENYLGFGPSAHSFWKRKEAGFGRRWWNISNLSHYCGRLLDNQLPLISQEFVKTRELMNERVFLGLRSDGLDLTRFEREFGVMLFDTHGPTIKQLISEEYAAIDDQRLRLTPKGFLLCDEISERLLP